MNEERARFLKILGGLRYSRGINLDPVANRTVKPTDSGAVLDVEQSFLKPVPKEKSLDFLTPPPGGSDNVE
jgi:hypothetical protein